MKLTKRFTLFLVLLSLLLSLQSTMIATAQEPGTATTEPTKEATTEPTKVAPTVAPAQEVTTEPTKETTTEPTKVATTAPTVAAKIEATVEATHEPTAKPTSKPTEQTKTESSNVETAAATNKALASNVILMNLDTTNNAAVTAQYLKEDGSAWTGAGDSNSSTSFTISPNGGQAFFDYKLSSLAAGRGSVVFQSDRQLAAVSQIKTWPASQVPTYDAYLGTAQGSDVWYLPFVAHNQGTASGIANTQIIIQNADSSPASVKVEFGSFTKNIGPIPASTSFYYDLASETGLGANFVGSAVVTSTGGQKIVVVTNTFFGPDGLQTANAFAKENVTTNGWLIPIFNSRLANGLNTTVFVQNLSGGTIAAGKIIMTCNKGDGSPGNATITVSNPADVANNASTVFNPVTDKTNFSDAWYGACRITTDGKSTVSYIQQRYVGVPNSRMGTFQAIRADSTDKTVVVPSVAKKLANGYATVIFIQNVSDSAVANINLTYTPSPQYAGIQTPIQKTATIPAGGLLMQNLRIDSGAGSVSEIAAGWYGTAKVVSSDQPIAGITQLTFLTDARGGDDLMVTNLTTQP